jgi:thioredoxin reductase
VAGPEAQLSVTDRILDVVIVGAGPAGLSAALILGRCRRSVLVCDAGEARNRASHALHGFLTRDGMPPHELLAIGRRQLEPYDTVEIRDVAVTAARCRPDGRFDVSLAGGAVVTARKLLIATGVSDRLPEIGGFHDFYGRSVFHCPYCDGWEFRDQPIAVYGRGARALGLSLELTAWTRDLVLCTDGPSGIDGEGLARLARHRIAVREDRVSRLDGHDGLLTRVVFEGGGTLARRALFFTTGQTQHSPLALELGCEFNDKGTVRTGRYETTHLPGLFVAGDASRDVQWVIVAAAEGAEAAFAINTGLLKEDLP